MSRIVYIDEDDIVVVRRNPRQDLYRRLDVVQQQALENARLAAEWYNWCSCNPVNGGSGICGCVNPYNYRSVR